MKDIQFRDKTPPCTRGLQTPLKQDYEGGGGREGEEEAERYKEECKV